MSAVFNFTFVPWFRSVAPYIHLHRGKTFVVGMAGEAIAAGKLQNIAQDLALIQSMGVKIVLVHGFRPQVNEQPRAMLHSIHTACASRTPSRWTALRKPPANCATK
jgi:amino-acid N-acetyltransferase